MTQSEGTEEVSLTFELPEALASIIREEHQKGRVGLSIPPVDERE